MKGYQKRLPPDDEGSTKPGIDRRQCCLRVPARHTASLGRIGILAGSQPQGRDHCRWTGWPSGEETGPRRVR